LGGVGASNTGSARSWCGEAADAHPVKTEQPGVATDRHPTSGRDSGTSRLS
jgi:hypothetical protein